MNNNITLLNYFYIYVIFEKFNDKIPKIQETDFKLNFLNFKN